MSYFISLLMYGLNDINGENKGLKGNDKLYRGLTMSYINLSFYERNIDNIITFPSFTSCSIKKDIAKMYSGRISSSTSYYIPLEKRKTDGIFSVLIIIDYKYKNGWEPTAFNVCEMSE